MIKEFESSENKFVELTKHKSNTGSRNKANSPVCCYV